MKNPYHVTTLPNGSRIIFREMPDAHTVGIAYVSQTGYRVQSEKTDGWLTLDSILMLQGSRKYPDKRKRETLEKRIAADFHPTLSSNALAIAASSPARHAEKAADIVSDSILHPLFDPMEFQRNIENETTKVKAAQKEPSMALIDLAADSVYPGFLRIFPTLSSLAAATPAQIRAFHNRVFHAAETVALVAGPIRPEQAVSLVRDTLLALPSGRKAAWPDIRKAPPMKPLAVRRMETKQVQARIAFRNEGFSGKDRDTFSVLRQILDGGMSSRLFTRVRDRKGLCYSCQAGGYNVRGNSYHWIQGTFRPDSLEEALVRSARELRRLVLHRVGKTELDRAKESLAGAARLRYETPFAFASRAGIELTADGRLRTNDELVAAIRSVSAADIQALATRLFRPEAMSLLLVLPEKGGSPAALRRAVVKELRRTF